MTLKSLSFSRRSWGLAALVLLATAASAATLKTFLPNNPALAADVNANFSAVLTPAGTVVAWAGVGGTPPTGWLFCDGTGFSGATYPDLQAALGGSQTTPDLRGRVIVGIDSGFVRIATGGAASVGSAGGFEAAQLPAHTHGIDPDPGHSHGIKSTCNGSGCVGGNDGFARGSSNFDNSTFTTFGAGAHSHGGATQSAGIAGATNMQPYLTLRYLIKT